MLARCDPMALSLNTLLRPDGRYLLPRMSAPVGLLPMGAAPGLPALSRPMSLLAVTALGPAEGAFSVRWYGPLPMFGMPAGCAGAMPPFWKDVRTAVLAWGCPMGADPASPMVALPPGAPSASAGLP